MTAEQTPRALRTIITITGRRNAGKSSLINAITGQDISIVSPIAGTTTDAVAKPYELLPLGAVTFYDTAGLDDEGSLGEQRIKATRKILYRTDIAVLVIGEQGLGEIEKNTIAEIKKLNIPLLAVFNKSDLYTPDISYCQKNNIEHIVVSSQANHNIEALKEKIIEIAPPELKEEPSLLGDIIKKDDLVVLVTPIDTSAPKGRLILPQVQILREILDCNAQALVTKETELKSALQKLNTKPTLVITDSQVVLEVAKDVPDDINITTFSILFARYKSNLTAMIQGAKTIDTLKDGDKILIAEACSHHVQADDIGKVKIPAWLKKHTGKDLYFDFSAGHDFPDDLEKYALIIHCGACMLGRTEMMRRLNECTRRNIPITNYGIAISKLQGVLERTTRNFM